MLWLTRHQLKSKNTAARRKATAELCRNAATDSRVINPLIGQLSDRDPEIRRMAMAAIGKSEDERRPELIRRGLADADPSVKRAAISAIKRVKGDEFVTLLSPLIEHADFGVRAAAAEMLDSLKWKPKD